MGTKRVGFARIRSLINENTNQLKIRRKEALTVTGTSTLTAADSGKVVGISFNSASTAIVTLPSAQAGLEFEFQWLPASGNVAMSNNSAKVQITAADGALVGYVSASKKDGGGAGGAVSDGTDTKVTVQCSASEDITASTRIRCVCIDGTNWLVDGHVVTEAGTPEDAVAFS